MHEQKKDKSKDYSLGLHWAATTGNVGLVKFALDHGAPIDAVVNGFMPLQLACISDNNIAVVQYLIDRGAEVNAQRWSKKHSADKSQAVAGAIGSTALHVACANGCAKIVDLLLRNGATVNVKDKYGSSPLDIAAAKHHVEIVRLLELFGTLQRHQRQQQHLQQEEDEPMPRRSMDVSSMAPSQKAERFRRPSLPSVFEGKSQGPRRGLEVPPLSTLPTTTPVTTIPSSASCTNPNTSTETTITPTRPYSGTSARRLSAASTERNDQVNTANANGAIDSKSGGNNNSNSRNKPTPSLPPSSSDPRAPRRSLNMPRRLSTDELTHFNSNTTASIDIRKRRPSRNSRTPELASSKSSDESAPDDALLIVGTPPGNTTNGWSNTTGTEQQKMAGRPDWYGYGVVNHYDDEHYLLSLERRAFGVEEGGRRSLDQRPMMPLPPPPPPPHNNSGSSSNNGNISKMNAPALKRCSSDGGYLRTAALMNAMAAKEMDDGEPTPRPSVALDDGPEANALRQFQEKEMKKAWWSAFGGRKSMDVATYHYYQNSNGKNDGRKSFDGRKSLDLRPSLDSLSQLAKGLSRRSIDSDYNRPSSPNEYSASARPGLLSRLVGAWSRK
ncbi:hypothetical protein BCR43DRAFT_452762 [Syncephalastrum racemosum]|uniref:Uncharacterized protein n=1 Tax=Syncephalastrum racemosum TaxID=13706 RepID=A0A1X2HMN8_SYNRA|nr:hypothetical protein BCR43DRAFT_452762 [Syncephalastrum racemosum]